MYTEEYEKRGFPIGNILIKLVLIVIFVLLLCWLLPKFIKPTVVNECKNSGSSGKVCDKTNTDALTSQIFSDNLEKMKAAAISYYTDERLPKNIGDSETMTLSDMIGKHLIVPLIDKNNKACDVTASYVKITKNDDEYIMKVNLKDSEKEDYILVHLGCYTYCKSYVCEKQTKSGFVKGGSTSTSSGYTITKVVPIKVYPSTPSVKYYCSIVNGKYYDKNGNSTSKKIYKEQCDNPGQETKYYCSIVNGKYYDKNGNEVSKEVYKKQCTTPKPEPKYYCTVVNGKYYGKDGKVVSKEVYKKQCTTPKPEPKYYCAIVNGKYYDKNGNVVSKEKYKESCEDKPNVKYLYQYKKVTEAKFSAWTKWSAWSKTSCDTQAINCNDSSTKCLKKLQTTSRKEQIGTYDKQYVKTRSVLRQTGSYTEKACSKYNYVIVNNTTYATTTTTTYTVINTITKTTKHTTGSWVYNGRGSYSNPPRDTENTSYKFVGADYSYCNETCSSLPNYYYDKYTYTGGMTKVTNVKSTPTYSSTTTSTTTSSSNVTVDASCGSYVTKTIPIYGYINESEIDTRKEPLYGTVCYSSEKTRTLLQNGKITYKWSTSSNSSALIKDGWVYTGVKKVA